METDNTLSGLRNALGKDVFLGQAILALHEYQSRYSFLSPSDQLADIERDYRLMKDFLLQGYADPKREELYRQLLRRVYILSCEMDLTVALKTDGVYSSAQSVSRHINVTPENVRSQLENYVQDVAMAGLSTANTNSENTLHELYKRHFSYMNCLFAAILSSPQWTLGYSQAFAEMLLAPTIEPSDAQWLASAVMLSAINFPDVNKLKTLQTLFMHTSDETLRQRALVGWSLSIPSFRQDLFPEIGQMISEACTPDILQELLELQKQVVFCIQAEEDNRTIQQDIMPELIRNSNVRFTRFGIEEAGDDAVESILNPNADDEKMERVEQGMRRMMDMQRQGADIYFGGFSQMKRFPFFSYLCNWFAPFSLNHYMLDDTCRSLSDNRFLQMLFEKGPFCDSDKYSFAFAVAQVVNRLPDNMREMMGNEEMFGQAMQDEELLSPTYIRRKYLQDVYRFFRLYPQKASFVSPFSSGKNRRLLFSLSLRETDFGSQCSMDLARFLYKKRQYELLIAHLNAYRQGTDADYFALYGWALVRLNRHQEAKNCFEEGLRIAPDNERLLLGMAQSCFVTGDYAMSAIHFDTLRKAFPQHWRYALNYCLSAVEDGRSSAVMNELYHLQYEHENDISVLRAIAWAYLKQGLPGKAQLPCDQILSSSSPLPDDYLNASYCYWAQKDIQKVVSLLRQYSEKGDKKRFEQQLTAKWNADQDVLNGLGISETDRHIMLDILADRP